MRPLLVLGSINADLYIGSDRQLLGRGSRLGSFVVKEVYRRFRDRDFLSATIDSLLTWNRWWERARLVDGFLRLGSHPYPPKVGHWEETNSVGALKGSLFEAALDNSPMYDDVDWDDRTHTQE